ncbi:RNase adapter RapZ [Gallaecimonas xiamenensis]|uniref:RNase adapter protein RapZ n=1 Tax=Gallaecimonas xiamenensis 3-C-1 TaxID=745411 RepID=K2J9I5_9GAMM|nr:RNase adapter RapZ [Gallaecimonas xiamenensis]EKE71492.1 glmZ(sRNA)-inactivating NTPase [Gallaecimonas xiamenensis 3-C-1]
MNLVIVSGTSGAGKSVALKVLEDLGYYCVDNLPLNLLPALMETLRDDVRKVAVSIDIRNLPEAEEDLTQELDWLPDDISKLVLYLDADQSVLLRRFSETRRLHPLSRLSNRSLEDALELERKRLLPLCGIADLRMDTSDMSIHQLAELIRERILGKKEGPLVMVFESFGFKHGLPKDADYVFDVRFLPNPHWVPELKPLTGKDQQVKDFFAAEQDVARVLAQLDGLLESWLPQLERNNRAYVTVAIGCTGGQHRSVFIAEQLADRFESRGRDVQRKHRDMKG